MDQDVRNDSSELLVLVDHWELGMGLPNVLARAEQDTNVSGGEHGNIIE